MASSATLGSPDNSRAASLAHGGGQADGTVTGMAKHKLLLVKQGPSFQNEPHFRVQCTVTAARLAWACCICHHMKWRRSCVLWPLMAASSTTTAQRCHHIPFAQSDLPRELSGCCFRQFRLSPTPSPRPLLGAQHWLKLHLPQGAE